MRERSRTASLPLRFLFRWNREILDTSALLGNVEGQRLRGSTAAGILHVVHFASDSGEGVAGLQSHSGLALRLKDHRTVLDIHDLVCRLLLVQEQRARWQNALH